MHIAQQKELDVHKTKQRIDRNRTTTSLVLDSSMQRGRREFRLKPANLVAFIVSIWEPPNIFFKDISCSRWKSIGITFTQKCAQEPKFRHSGLHYVSEILVWNTYQLCTCINGCLNTLLALHTWLFVWASSINVWLNYLSALYTCVSELFISTTYMCVWTINQHCIHVWLNYLSALYTYVAEVLISTVSGAA